MSSVYLTIPSKRSTEEANPVLQKWRDQGYKIALFIDREDEESSKGKIYDFRGVGTYPGYAQAVNGLIRNVMKFDPSAEWFVAAGDDTLPDPTHHAEAIARECSNYFHNSSRCSGPWTECGKVATFGVMQPIADGHGIETICGSPWLGREFCERVNGGTGPLWPEYTHCFADNELQDVAKTLGVLWQRPDLTHKHNHWSWTTRQMPEFLAEANSPAHWEKYKRLFSDRRAAGFPGHEPLPVNVAQEATA